MSKNWRVNLLRFFKRPFQILDQKLIHPLGKRSYGQKIALATLTAIVGVGILGAVATIFGPKISPPPPPPSTAPILKVMDAEAIDALNGDVQGAVSLYTDDAVVGDAQGGMTWSGINEIRSRYASLPKFKALKHLGAIVTFDNDSRRAQARASTSGIYINAAGLPVTISGTDGERWTFELVGRDWKVTIFIYNTPK